MSRIRYRCADCGEPMESVREGDLPPVDTVVGIYGCPNDHFGFVVSVRGEETQELGVERRE